jgi:hypothetical protein
VQNERRRRRGSGKELTETYAMTLDGYTPQNQ